MILGVIFYHPAILANPFISGSCIRRALMLPTSVQQLLNVGLVEAGAVEGGTF